jgi:hypothetical protein
MIRIPPHRTGCLITVYDTRDRADARAIVTSVRIDANPRHWHLQVWNRGGLAGPLCVDATDGPTILDRLIPPAYQAFEPHPLAPAAAGAAS